MVVHDEAAHAAEEPTKRQTETERVGVGQQRYLLSGAPDEAPEDAAKEAAVRRKAEPRREEQRRIPDDLHEGLTLVQEAVQEVAEDETRDDRVRHQVAGRDGIEVVALRESARNPRAEEHAGSDENAERLNRQGISQHGKRKR